VADRLAGIGYRALVPDLYQGKVTLDAAEAEHMMKNLKFGDATNQDIRGAAQYLKEAGTKVGVMGFCMGGALTVLAAVYVREVDAAVCWYGAPPEAVADTRTIAVPFQGHFARQDQFFLPSQIEAFEARLKQGKVRYELYWYDANHAFGNETGPFYDREAEKLAWKRSTDFLAKHLK
jgi:carboxymethylenebutenolidase